MGGIGRRVAGVALALAAAAGLAGAEGAAASRRCPEGMRCLTVEVPLDRTGAVPGRVRLPVAVQRGRGPLLLALSGGPGQGAVADARAFATVLNAVAPRYRVAVLDQRGTGAVAIRCPALQRGALSDLTVPPPGAVEACGAQLGTRRGAFATTATVADLEAVRRALGVKRMAIYGVSYGTYVAMRYARAHPRRVSRLVLDSVVPQENVDPLMAATMARAGVVLRRLCAGGACRGITASAEADFARLVERVGARPLHGRVRLPGGRVIRQRIDGPALLDVLVLASSFRDDLLAHLPGAVRAALRGDDRWLLAIAAEARRLLTFRTDELSMGLHAATLCADVRFPWGDPASPRAARDAAVAQAVAALDPRRLGPFDRATAAGNGLLETCRRWPATPVAPPPAPGPLPRVPILLLAGERDLSTPLADARREARRSPTARLVVVRGGGHSVASSDGCVGTTLRRFFADRPLGRPCRSAPALRLVRRQPGT